jgi:hypothetical protein
MDQSRSSKFSAFHRGALESGSLAEVAYFIKKAQQQLEHARYAMENADFSFSQEMLNPVDNKIEEIGRLIVETRRAVEVAAARMVDESNAHEDRLREKDIK